MRLTPYQKEGIRDRLTQIEPEMRCSACGSRTWDVWDFVTAFVEFPEVFRGQNGTSLPVVMLVCEMCGHVLTFPARKFGIEVATPEEDEEDNGEM